MSSRRVSLMLSVLLAGSLSVFGADTSGHYATHDGPTTETDLPNGGKAIVSHSYQLGMTDQANDPMNNTASDCVGKMILSKEGKIVSGSGMCFSKNVEGDGSSFWWKVDEVGTAKCPNLCGSWGYVNGYGKLSGITGGGTWVQTHLFGDGSIGTFKGTSMVK